MSHLRTKLIRLASSMPKGSRGRQDLLHVLAQRTDWHTDAEKPRGRYTSPGGRKYTLDDPEPTNPHYGPEDGLIYRIYNDQRKHVGSLFFSDKYGRNKPWTYGGSLSKLVWMGTTRGAPRGITFDKPTNEPDFKKAVGMWMAQADRLLDWRESLGE